MLILQCRVVETVTIVCFKKNVNHFIQLYDMYNVDKICSLEKLWKIE